MIWAEPPMARDQMVLFPSSLDDVIPEEHLVRDLDAILSAAADSIGPRLKRSITDRWELGRFIRGC